MKHFVPRSAAVSVAALSLLNRSRAFSKLTFVVSVILFCAISLVALQSASAVIIPTVPVGNVGNANDPATGSLYGGVGYAYNIGKYEVTVGQYTAFLNAVAATDTYALYNTSMATDLNIAGIAQSGASGTYSYSVIGSPDHPVTYVSWGDAARFSNWLHNGQPTGAQNASTTEDGAYPLNGAIADTALNAVSRNAGARWFISTENEWYKAAYHQPAAQGGDLDDYWLLPTRTNSTSYSDQPPGSGAPIRSNTANTDENDGLANGYNDGFAVTRLTSQSSSQNYLTDVGAYTSSTSPYGTFDQGGNVFEWNETLIDGSFRGLRGGSWIHPSNYMKATVRFDFDHPTKEFSTIGFRVATVPEPSTAVLAVMACGLMWGLRKRFKEPFILLRNKQQNGPGRSRRQADLSPASEPSRAPGLRAKITAFLFYRRPPSERKNFHHDIPILASRPDTRLRVHAI